MRREFDAYDAQLSWLSRDELRAGGVVDPQDVYGSNFPWGRKTFCMLKQLDPIDLITARSLAARFVATWLLWDTPLVYPIKIFVMMLHELGHTIAARLTDDDDIIEE